MGFDLGSIFFGGKAFRLGKGHCRNLLYFRKFDFKDFQPVEYSFFKISTIC